MEDKKTGIKSGLKFAIGVVAGILIKVIFDML